MRSSLAPYQPDTGSTPEQIYHKKRSAWISGEGLHLNSEQIKNLKKEHQWAIEIIGNLIYGDCR